MKTKADLLEYWRDLPDHIEELLARYRILSSGLGIGSNRSYILAASWDGLETAARMGLVTVDEQEDVTVLNIHLGMCIVNVSRVRNLMHGNRFFVQDLENAREDLKDAPAFIPKTAAFIHDVSASLEGLIRLMPHMTLIPGVPE